MNKRAIEGFIKHGDFIVLDVLCLQACFVLSYWMNVRVASPYDVPRYNYQGMVMLVAQFFVILFSNNYHGIVRRKRFDEFTAVFAFMVEVFVLALVYLFVVHRAGEASRLQMGWTSAFYILLDFVVRELNKFRLRRRGSIRGQQRSLVLVTSRSLVHEALAKLTGGRGYQRYFVSSIVLLDGTSGDGGEVEGIPITPLDAAALADITHGWVDEVFILQPDDVPFPADFVEDLMEMGMTVSYSIFGTRTTRFNVTDSGKLGPYAVLTSRIREVSMGQLIIKRLFDVVGGFVGCIITAVAFVIVAPIIYAKSPGPIFFVQERVGLNGKPFKMYKFRSMYLDAEQRKAELEDRNRVDGLMFKVKDDPRIIGSEKKGPDGRSRGIGNFIRRYSIDELPQFFNVLRGEMSLVGTRPPTLDEWERYDLEHRVRMSIKPGITGLWQVSGRSKITDFSQVVRLDREYIESWNLGLDLKIMAKTVVVVIGGRGAL